MNKSIKALAIFSGGLIAGAIASGIIVQNMSSKMWNDIHTQIDAYELKQTTKALERLQADRVKEAIRILEERIDDGINRPVDGTTISQGTKELYSKAANRAKEYREQYPKEE